MNGWIGAARCRVIIERASRVPDDAGGHTLSWEPVAAVWATMETVSGSEGLNGERIEAARTRRVRIRRRSDVDASMRLSCGNVIMNIRSVLDVDGNPGFLMLICTEVSYGG